MACLDTKGYVKIFHEGKQYYEHRLIITKYLNRKLSRQELVHHKNGDRADNRLENLQIVTRSEHKKLHPNLLKTHCKWGHKFTEENTYIEPSTEKKKCRKCIKIRKAKYDREIRDGIKIPIREYKTHCVNGHKLTKENIYIQPLSGSMWCKICKSISYQRWYNRRENENNKQHTES